MTKSLGASVLKSIANAAVCIALLLQVFLCYKKFEENDSLNWLGLVIVNAVMVSMYVARSDAKQISKSLALWILAFAGTCMPLAVRPSDSSGLTTLGSAVQLAGTVAMLLSFLSLRRSFGIVPANRGIRTSGLYQWIRHPLYASELLVLCGVVLVNPSPLNVLVFAIAALLQFSRAVAEEQFLSTDPIYAQYRSRVRYRLIPGLL